MPGGVRPQVLYTGSGDAPNSSSADQLSPDGVVVVPSVTPGGTLDAHIEDPTSSATSTTAATPSNRTSTFSSPTKESLANGKYLIVVISCQWDSGGTDVHVHKLDLCFEHSKLSYQLPHSIYRHDQPMATCHVALKNIGTHGYNLICTKLTCIRVVVLHGEKLSFYLSKSEVGSSLCAVVLKLYLFIKWLQLIIYVIVWRLVMWILVFIGQVALWNSCRNQCIQYPLQILGSC